MSTLSREKPILLQVDPKSQHADLYLIGYIGSDWWSETGNTASSVLAQLAAYTELKNITVHLSTMGGSFLDGLPIYNILKQHPAHVTINIIGYALSMGSVIMLAGDTINAAQNSIIMIHNAQGGASGSAADLRKVADILDTHEQAIIPRYSERMGKTPAEIQALLDAETWYSADQALEAGLVDAITDAVDIRKIDKKQPKNAWEFAATFKHPPPDFVTRLESQCATNVSWVEKFLNRALGTPPASLNLPDNTDEVAMTTEELTAAIEVAVQKAVQAQMSAMVTLFDTKLTELKTPGAEEEAEDAPDGLAVELAAKLATAQADNATLTAENAAMKAKIDTLDATLAADTRAIPESIGAAGEWAYDY